MEIIERNIEELIPYENNPRNNDAAVEYVANSIKEFGFKNPIIIDKNNVIVAGHTRLKAAEKLGLVKVPTIMADDLTDEQIRAFRIADNKTAEISVWDFEKLREELDQVLDFEMEEFGFNEAELIELTVDDGYGYITPNNNSHGIQDEDDDAFETDYDETDHYNPPESNRSNFIENDEISKDDLNYYSQRAEQQVSKRVIIVYSTDEEERFLKKVLRQEEDRPLKTVIDIKSIRTE